MGADDRHVPPAIIGTMCSASSSSTVPPPPSEPTPNKGVAMDIIISVAAKIAEYMVAPIGRQFGYIHYYKDNLERLKTEVQKLEGNKDCVQHSVDEAKGDGEEIENIVQNWLRKVDHTVVEAKKFVDTEGHANAECCMGHIPNLWTRHHLSKKTKEMMQEISEVLAEGRFDRISYHAASQVTATPFGRGYEALDSRTSMLNEIMLALKDPNMFIIGVYGMGGVGKTMLVKELAWQAEKDESFGAIVMATITSSPDVESIQGQIADALDLKFDKETKEGRARQLRERIRKEKNILVILDDIWGRLDLIAVGIPFGDDHKGCKLVVTSRDLNVLNCEMRTQREFSLEVLLEEDSWKLFEKTAGDVVQEFNIKPIVVQVARYCGGLPLLIVTVAKALRKKDVSAWKDAVYQLERFDQEGLHKKVYSTLELSYNFLESDELKSLFLFIGSYGLSTIHTGVLFLCCWVLGLYRNVHTLTEARNRHYSLINELRASSLLLEREWDSIKMHDLVRDTAKSIASRLHPTFAVQRYTEVKEWSNVDQLKMCHHIIVPHSYIHELLEKLECPELELLVLQNIGDHLKVPDDFFSGMRKVKVLRLYGMVFNPSPPPSLRLLTNIQSLDLSNCMLSDIAILAELTSLEILSLERSDIKELPRQIGQLVHLRMLNLNNCSELRIIPANLFSSLTCLEELYMGGCFFPWGIKGKSKSNNSASLDELRNLIQLKTLEIRIQDASVLPRDLQFFKRLENYSIYIGDNWNWPLQWSCGTSEPSRILKLMESNSTSILLDHGFAFLLKTVEDMSLSGVTCVRDVLYELNREGFPQLKHLHIQCSSELKYIINSMGRVHLSSAFPNLETLAFQNLVNLEDVCHGSIPLHSFTKLKKIEVRGCDKLKNLLSYSLVRGLPQLLEIKISECTLMTEVIAEQTPEGDNEMDKIMFPRLHSLILECLPSLISFCSLPSTATMGSVALFDQEVEMPDLKTLMLSNINSCKLWNDQPLGYSSIQNLRSLTIDNCGNMAYAFSSLVARELVDLQYLQISNCQMLVEIFALDGNLGNHASSYKTLSNEEVIFPKLEALVISHMDRLKSVWHNQLAPNSFCKLKKLETKFCNELSNVVPSYVLNKLQNLETMIVTNCPALEVVFEMQDLTTGVDRQAGLQMQLKTLTLEHLPMLKHIWSRNPNGSFRFQKLCQLKATECKSLNHVFPLSVAKELSHLRVLFVEKCGVENIVVQDEVAGTVPILVFPELTSLTLRSLKQLRSFYQALHTMDCPVLRELDVFHCDQLELFMPKSLYHQEIVPVDPQPLLSIEKVVPNIRELILSRKDASMLCNGQLIAEPVYTVKALRLRCFHDELDKFPSGFLQKFINLENLTLTCSSFTEIFSIESFGTGHSETSMKLRSLVLVELNNLKFICGDKSGMHLVLKNLQVLVIFGCSGLSNIVPSSVLFENIEKLTVGNCGGLENIMALSTATNLPKLRHLCIDGCEKIEEIVASDSENDAGELTFMKLKYLRLKNLPRLRSFCKGRYGFKFPLLQKLFVIDCRMMETFSYGVLNAPKLRAVHVKPQKEWHWNGDLNTTIRNFFSKMNSKDGLGLSSKFE